MSSRLAAAALTSALIATALSAPAHRDGPANILRSTAAEFGAVERVEHDTPTMSRSIAWTDVPRSVTYHEGTTNITLTARFTIHSVIGGWAYLEHFRDGVWTEAQAPQRIGNQIAPGTGRAVSWTLPELNFDTVGLYRIRTWTGAGSGTYNTTEFTLSLRLDAPTFPTQLQDLTVDEGDEVTLHHEALSPDADGVTVTHRMFLSVAGGGWNEVSTPFVATPDLDNALMRFTAERRHMTNPYVHPHSATSFSARLYVRSAPTVTEQPSAVTVLEGDTASFVASASGNPAPAVAWQQSTDGGTTWTDLDGATGSGLRLDEVGLEQTGHLFRAVFTNAVGTAVTDAAALTVSPAAPVIVEHPQDASAIEGSAVRFVSLATGHDVRTRWEVSTDAGETWAVLPGASSMSLDLEDVAMRMDGWRYRATHTNSGGESISNPARLRVHTTPPRASVSIAPIVRLIDAPSRPALVPGLRASR